MQEGRLQQAQVGGGRLWLSTWHCTAQNTCKRNGEATKREECENKEVENLFWLTACKTRHARLGDLDWPNKP